MSDEEPFVPNTGRISANEWRTIVKNVPIVSVDLVVLDDGGVVLGKRQNRPAKGEWFVPGGRVYKHERLEDAVHRIAREELGVKVEIVERLGAYEHLYHDAELDGVSGKHYLANGFVVKTDGGEVNRDDQHTEMRVFEETPDDLHEYVEAYFRDTTSVMLD